MFLVTTADQRFWKTDDKILFLGEWCKTFSQRSIWEKLDYEVLPYHWDDRKQLYEDYLYLDELYEQTLLQMRDILNQIHGVTHSLRYWRIIVGPWLYYFIQILYDRYQSILTAINSNKVTNTLISSYSDMRSLQKEFPWFVKDDCNHYLYSRIIEFIGKMPFDVVATGNISKPKKQSYSIRHRFTTKNILKKLIELYGKFIPDRFNQIVLISSYLQVLDLIRLQLLLKQHPYLLPPDVAVPEKDIDLAIREKLYFTSAKSEFETLLGKMVKEQMPLIYVEGYAEMNKRSLKAFPKNPKVIFTANAYSTNEGFKFWAAHHVDRGVKLAGTQHGGHYGTGLWSSTDNHEIKISDIFYTWGWKSDVYENTKPLSAAKLNKAQNIRFKKDGRILIALMSMPRYSYHLYSVPVSASGMLAYFNDQYDFVRHLSKENQKSLIVRVFPVDYGWDQFARWNRKFPRIECYEGSKSMFDQLNESRLFVSTYNATTYLETFAANFPTVMFWNPCHWELNPSAKSYFQELRHVGILHDTPESAAALVNQVSHDPESWWNQSEIQRAKDQFCFQFARTSDNWLIEWKEELFNLAENV